METKPQMPENTLEQEGVRLEFFFSQEREVDRIRGTLSKIAWYRENGYKINLPVEIQNMLSASDDISRETVQKVVSLEYEKTEYEAYALALRIKWEKDVEDFMRKFSMLGRPLQDRYKISLTKYGSGGSYGFPNGIALNFAFYNSLSGTFSVLKHEVIHLTIEDLIKKYKIKHWVKERLVDLIFSKFFGNEMHIQREEDIMQEVSDIFELYFPDIEKVIIEIGKLEKYIDKEE